MLAQQQPDVVEVGSLGWLLGPAALHQLAQLGFGLVGTRTLSMVLRVDGGSQAGPLTQNHPVHDLCWDIGMLRRRLDPE